MSRSSWSIGSLLPIVVVQLLLVVGGVYGYVSNILGLVNTIDLPVTGMTILRGIGIVVFPLGIILGYL